VTRRRVVLSVAVAAFLVASALVARWLSAEGDERARVERLLAAQGRGDAAAMARELEGCDARCRRGLDRLAARLARPGEELEVVRYDSSTARSLGDAAGPTRVVWQLGRAGTGSLPTVQCVRVRRTGNPIAGHRVRLTGLSGPIAREGSC